MPRLLRAADRPPGPSRTVRFEGADHGASIAFFAVDSDPGARVALHVHPYTETWFVQEGRVKFRAGGETLEAGPGDIMVVEPEVAHGFANIGDGRLKMMCIHDSPTIIQTFLEPDD